MRHVFIIDGNHSNNSNKKIINKCEMASSTMQRLESKIMKINGNKNDNNKTNNNKPNVTIIYQQPSQLWNDLQNMREFIIDQNHWGALNFHFCIEYHNIIPKGNASNNNDRNNNNYSNNNSINKQKDDEVIHHLTIS